MRPYFWVMNKNKQDMKNKFLIGSGLLGLGIILLSFSKGDEPKMLHYEVIRSVNGEIITYDTLVPVNSEFTAERYLAQLGFDQDKHIQIVQINAGSPMMPVAAPDHLQFFYEGDSQVVMHCIKSGEISGDSVIQIEMIMGDQQMSWEEASPGETRIEKNIIIRQVDSLNHEIVEMEKIIEVVITDNNELVPFSGTDSGMVITKTVVINDGDGNRTVEWESIEGEPSFERHMQEGNSKMDLMVFGEREDFTLVIVSDGDLPAQPKEFYVGSEKMPQTKLQIYPNPADKEVTIQMNFEEKANTTITVTNSEGKVMAQYQAGEISGAFSQTVDVSKWSKGIYLVTINRPGVKMVEKLVVE